MRSRELALSAGKIVELDDARRLGVVAELAGKARPVDRLAVLQPHEGVVDRAVIAAVEDEDLRPVGDRAGDTQGKAVGVGGRRRHLPEGQAERRLQQPADSERVLVGQHVGEAALGLAADGLGDRRRRMAEHRAGVAEAEIVELVAVDVGDRRAPGPVDEDRERHRPVAHPVHRHAAEIAGAPLPIIAFRLPPSRAIALRLAGAEIGDAGRIDPVRNS